MIVYQKGTPVVKVGLELIIYTGIAKMTQMMTFIKLLSQTFVNGVGCCPQFVSSVLVLYNKLNF